MTTPALECAGLRVGFANLVLFDELVLEIREGSRTALVGPSGSGKTTLLSTLGGLHSPLGGRIRVAGQDVSGADLLDRVAWIPQTTNALMRRTAWENAALGALGQGVPPPQARERALAALGQVGLRGLAEQRACELSGGERQRLAVARAAATGRSLLFADEPTGQLDAASSTRVAEAILTSPTGEQTVVISTHDLDLAQECDEIIDVGELRQRARPSSHSLV